MTFQSLEFILFFPIVFFLYWGIGQLHKTAQNGLLVAASLVFYSWWDVRFTVLLLLTVFSTFIAAQALDIFSDKLTIRKMFLGTVLVLNLGILFLFKYYNFFIGSLNDVLASTGVEVNLGTLKLLLPVGISFYTFSALSYCLDVYQRKIHSTNDWLAYTAYVTFFPSILSGPISRAQKQLPQYFTVRSFHYAQAVDGCRNILLGGIMKLCLADRLGIYVDAVYSNFQHHSGTTLVLTSVCYTLQIYADFAGYSLMAIGLGKLLGVELPTNFVRPYFARTVTDFWRRWHISLTTWFRDYIYFPMGGNRCSKLRWMFNTLVVFVVSGLWHGAAYTFLIWGAFHGICMIVERQCYGDRIKQLPTGFTLRNVFRWGLTFFIVNLAWIFFRIDNLDDVCTILAKIVTDHGSLFLDPDTLAYAFMFAVLVFVVDGIDEYFPGKVRMLNSRYVVVRWCTYLFLISLILLMGVLDGGSFIYFQF